jgi:predicted Zn-dependent peptidase
LSVAVLFFLQAPSHATYETGGVVKETLSNGVTTLVHPEPGSKVAAVEVFIKVGADDERAANAGIGQLLAGSILAGTNTVYSVPFARVISDVGGNLHSVWQWDYLEVYAVTLPQFTGDTISLLADSIKNSSIDPRAIEFSRTAILRQAQSESDDPFTCAYTALRKLIHRGGSYDRSYLGDPAVIRTITRDQVSDFYQKNVTASRIVISVVGDVDPNAIRRKVEVCFGGMPWGAGGGLSDRETGRQGDLGTIKPGEREIRIEKVTSTSFVMVGYPAPRVTDKDYSAMCVANVLLGGNKSSLLFTEMREKRGLGYQVGSVYPALCGESHIAAYLGLDSSRATPETLKTVKDTIVAQANLLGSGAFTDADLERAKGYLIGRHALDHERTRDRAYNLGLAETLGLGYQNDFLYADAIHKVTRDDVLHVCAKYLHDAAIVILTNPEPTKTSG